MGKPLKKRVIIEDNILYDLEGDLKDVLRFLTDLQQETKAYDCVRLSFYRDYGTHESAECVVNVTGVRDETDEEMVAREEREKADKEADLRWKWEQLRKLKAELGEIE